MNNYEEVFKPAYLGFEEWYELDRRIVLDVGFTFNLQGILLFLNTTV
jgi:hypothetical protein